MLFSYKQMRKLVTASLITLAIFAINPAWAEFVVRVIDGTGKPLSDAVVSIPNQGEPADRDLVLVDQVNKQFAPHVSLIDAGQWVNFPNSDNIRHHVYSFSQARTFEIKLYSGVPSNPIQFEQAGIVVLGCNIHDQMLGYIYVAAEQETTRLTDSEGKSKFPGNKPDSVMVWHEHLIGGPEKRLTVPLSEQLADGSWQLSIETQAPVVSTKRKFKSRFQ